MKLSSDLLTVELVHKEKSNNRLKYEYEVSIKGRDVPERLFQANIAFQTTNALKPEFKVPVSAEFSGAIEIIPKSLFFGRAVPGGTVEKQIRIVNNSDSALKILKVETGLPSMSYKELRPNLGNGNIEILFRMAIPKEADKIIRGNAKLLLENEDGKTIRINIPWLVIANSSS